MTTRGLYSFLFYFWRKNENLEKDTEIVTNTETDGWPFWHKGSLNTGRQANSFNGKRFYFFTLFQLLSWWSLISWQKNTDRQKSKQMVLKKGMKTSLHSRRQILLTRSIKEEKIMKTGKTLIVIGLRHTTFKKKYVHI